MEEKVLQDAKKLLIARYPRFAQQIANANLLFDSSLPSHTAATDGKNIYFDPVFFEKLDNDAKLFVIAHELMHIKFEHMYRMTKNGEKRNATIWNIATDAIINANLERDGFKIMDGLVNRPESLEYSAEELYDKLLKEQEQKQHRAKKFDYGFGQNSSNGNGKSGQNSNPKQGESHSTEKENDFAIKDGDNHGQDEVGNERMERYVVDDHSLWEKAFEEQENKESEQKPLDENNEFQENREERRKIAKQRFFDMINAELKRDEVRQIELGEIGKENAIVDWKLILMREFNKTGTIWSQRRSIAENNYAYRLEENEDEQESETEVMLDVSASIEEEMLKSFLRQLKPLLKESKLKVGFFAGQATEKFQEIKTERDIDKLNIVIPGEGTNMDAAARAFSKSKSINKIVFTDGWAGKMPKSDLKNENIIWLVYENHNFKPCCGKVINLDITKLKMSSNQKHGRTT